MKKNNNNSISELSKKDYKKFFEDKMNEEEKKKFLSDSENTEFEKEAVKGYTLIPLGISDINDIDKTIKTNFKGNISITNKILFIGTPIIITLLLIFIYLKTKPTSQTAKNNNILTENINTIKIDTHKINIINKEIQKAEISDESKQISSIQAKTDQKSVTDFEKNKPLETINKLKITSINNSFIDSSNSKSFSGFINMPIDYFYEFKIIDYSKIYNNKIKTDIFETGSIAAKYENKQNSSDDNNNLSSNYVKYSEFLYDAMGKMSTNNYKSALQDYIVIIQHFSKDQNANFYGGLCYYNLGLYDNSIKFFDVILESNVAIFFQEAKWYKANSLMNSNKIKEAKQEFNEIISSKGFYADRAKEKLSQIDK